MKTYNYKYNKYKNQKVMLDGIEFDSIRERDRYAQLKLMERAGHIKDLQLQVKFVLIPTQYEEIPRYGKRGQPLKPGRRVIEKETAYYADFVYKVGDETVVEDTKGHRTDEYKIKRKLMLYVHGIKIQEV